MAKNKNSKNETEIKYIISRQDLEEDDTIYDIKIIIDRFIKNWWLFLLTTVLAIGIAYFATKFIQPKYKVSTSLVINEDNSLTNAPAALMQEIGFITGDKNFLNEVFLLQASPLIQSALDKLDLRVSYYKKEPIGYSELYKSSPFIVLINPAHTQPVGCRFNIKITSQKTCVISIDEEEMHLFSFVTNQTTQIVKDYQSEQEVIFGNYIGNDFFSFKILLNNEQDLEELLEQEFSFVINTDKSLITAFKEAMEIIPPDKQSTVAELSMETAVPVKAIDFLNSLTESYLHKDFLQKQHTAEKTIEYINEQLDKVSESLNLAEDNLQNFRSQKKILDVSMQSQQIFDELKELKKEKAVLDVNLKYVEYIQDYFKQNNTYTDLISPASMGIEDPTLNSLIEELISLNIEKVSFIDNNQEKNPYLQKINIRIDNLRSMISENINYIKRTTNIAIEDADSRINQLNKEIEKMPETERALLGIERVFDINNSIYTYLLEKKSEAEIAKASYQSDIEIAEPADIVGNTPVSPDKKIYYLISLLMGLAIPSGFLYIKEILSTSFISTEEIKKASLVPVIGEINRNSKKIEDVVAKLPESHIAESFRKLTFNLKYFMNDNSGKIIALSSSISGEGKSFVALNLAQTLANNNYRTVLAGFDIRRPKKYASLRNKIDLGISDILINQASVDDVIQKTDNEYLDILPAGNIPPNPAELLSSNRTGELINEIKENYDFVIIDTPPVGVVTDGFSLMEKADLNIFVSRVKHTPKKEFEELISELKEKKLISGLVINDIPVDRRKSSKYGYKYYKAY